MHLITDAEIKKTNLLVLMGLEAFESFIEFMTARFVSKRSEFTELCGFRAATKGDEESVDEYELRLRRLAAHCNFGDQLETEVLRQFAPGCKMIQFQQECCREDKLTLALALKSARGYERTKKNVAGLFKDKQHLVVCHTSERTHVKGYSGSARTEERGGKQCGYCGEAQHLKKEQCRALGKKCSKCLKINHFAKVCRGDGSRKDNSREQERSPRTATRVSWQGDRSADQRSPRINRVAETASTRGQQDERGEYYTVSRDDYDEWFRYKRAYEHNINAVGGRKKQKLRYPKSESAFKAQKFGAFQIRDRQ